VALAGMTTSSNPTSSAPLPDVNNAATPDAPFLVILGRPTVRIEHVVMIMQEN
jgi:hypothetical protein